MIIKKKFVFNKTYGKKNTVTKLMQRRGKNERIIEKRLIKFEEKNIAET